MRGGFETDEDLLNRAEPVPEIDFSAVPGVATAETKSTRYEALPAAMIAFLAVCMVAGGAAVWRLKPQTIGDYLKLSVDARSALARADGLLRQHHVDPNSYRHSALPPALPAPTQHHYPPQPP